MFFLGGMSLLQDPLNFIFVTFGYIWKRRFKFLCEFYGSTRFFLFKDFADSANDQATLATLTLNFWGICKYHTPYIGKLEFKVNFLSFHGPKWLNKKKHHPSTTSWGLCFGSLGWKNHGQTQ